MKKVIIACIIVLCMALVPAVAFAAGASQPEATELPQAEYQAVAENPAPEAQAPDAPEASQAAEQGAPRASGYVDADGDGVCDNYASGGNGRHHGAYVDADGDGDGICDNYGTGTGGRHGAFVDADGDGVCDNYGTGQCPGAGNAVQNGHHGADHACGHGCWR